MHPYLLNTEWLVLRWENIMMIAGVLIGAWIADRRAASKGERYRSALLDLYVWLVLAGIAGARAWEMIFTWDEYTSDPWARFAIWDGGMSIQGAVLGGLIAALLFARRRRINPWVLLDILAPSVILGQGIGRIGCLLSGDAFGRPVAEVPWFPSWLGLVYSPESPAWEVFGNTPLIPAEAMEGLLDFAVFAFLVLWRPRRAVPGRTVLLYALLYSLVRFSLEFLRADSLMLWGVKVAQLLSLGVILAAGLLLWYRTRIMKTAG